MLNTSVESIQTPSSRFQLWSTPYHLILTIMWLATTAVMVTMLWLGVRETGRYVEVRYLVAAGYVASLIWYLIRSGPSLNQLPELQPLLFPRRRFGAWIPVLGIALLLALTASSDASLLLFFIVTIVATIWILIAWRRQIRLRSVVQGLGLTLIIYFPALTMFKNGATIREIFFFFLVFVPPIYVAGGLLFQHTRLGEVQLLAKRYRKAFESFIWGSFLSGALGLEHVGVTGFSKGGAAAGQFCATDARCQAGINFTGFMYGDILDSPLHAPFFFMSEEELWCPECFVNDLFYRKAESDAFQMKIRGARHVSFGDFGMFGRLIQLGNDKPDIAGARMIEIQNAYSLAFFDRYLKGVPSPLLDGPSPYPEVMDQEKEGRLDE